ncbi:MAG: hypothetical protein INR73_29265 [Williamsia sp.]|nr:hypothetical protein [Williamsia sp.]
MALSKESVAKAIKILRKIDPQITNPAIVEFREEVDDLRPNVIFGVDPKIDGGWENVFINVVNLSADKRAEFGHERRKIYNSYFINQLPDSNVTRLGWF